MSHSQYTISIPFFQNYLTHVSQNELNNPIPVNYVMYYPKQQKNKQFLF